MNASLPHNGTFTPNNVFSFIRMSYRMAVERERERERERESIISPVKTLLFLPILLKKSLLFQWTMIFLHRITIYQKKGGKGKCKQ